MKACRHFIIILLLMELLLPNMLWAQERGVILPNKPLLKIPIFKADPFWPKPLPKNWILGEVAGVSVDSNDHVWVLKRPKSLSEDECGAALLCQSDPSVAYLTCLGI